MSLTLSASNGHRFNESGRTKHVPSDGHALAADAAGDGKIFAWIWERVVGMTSQCLGEALFFGLAFHGVLHRHGRVATASIATVLLVSRLVGIVGGSIPSACRNGDAAEHRKREYRQFKWLVASCQVAAPGRQGMRETPANSTLHSFG